MTRAVSEEQVAGARASATTTDRPGAPWMWRPFYAALAGCALLFVSSLVQTARVLSTMDLDKVLDDGSVTAYVVGRHRVLIHDLDEDGADEVLAWTQEYDEERWKSRITAFRVESGAVIWQSELLDTAYAKHTFACLVPPLLLIGTPQQRMRGLRLTDGSQLWQAAFDGRAVECLLGGQSAMSGVPTQVAFRKTDGSFVRLDGKGGTTEAQPPPAAPALASDCYDCARPGYTRHREEDPFILPGAYLTGAYPRLDGEATLLVGDADSGGLVIGASRRGELVWHEHFGDRVGKEYLDFDERAVAVSYQADGPVSRVRLLSVLDGATLWDVALASPNEEPDGAIVTLGGSWVVASHANIATVLRRENGERVTVLGGRSTREDAAPRANDKGELRGSAD